MKAEFEWANRCPRCGHTEDRDHGPGEGTQSPECPECDWPMNLIQR